VPDDLEPSLSTRYRRVTLAAREGRGRVTLDFEVELNAMDNRGVRLSEDPVLVEIKTEGVDGALRRSFHLLASRELG
jgi:hypothetical protein